MIHHRRRQQPQPLPPPTERTGRPVTNHQTVTDLDAAKALIAAGSKLLEVRFEVREGDRRPETRCPANGSSSTEHEH